MAVTGALILWQGAALAGTSKGGDAGLGGLTDVVTEATGQLEDTAEEVLDEVNGGIGDTSDDGESPSGSGSDTSAEGGNLGVDVAGQEVLRVGGSESSAGGGNSRSGSNILAVLGHQIIGTSSEHDDTGWEESTFGTLGFSCAASDGALCVDLLYGHSWADGSSSSSDTDAAYVCLAGGQTTPDETCEGPVALRVLDSHSDASDSGARQSSEGARLCLGNEDADGVCQGVGVSVIESESSNENGTEEGSTTLGSLEAEGEEQGSLGDPQALDAPPECPDGDSLLCVNLNDDNSTDDGDDGRETVDGDIAPGANDGGDVANANAGESDVTEGDGDAGEDDGIGLDHPGSGEATADGRVLHIKLLGQEILVFGQADSASDDDGSSSDATVLAVLGNEVIGTHSDSEDGSGHDETGLLRETCSETDGQACFALLYGQASSEATDTGSTGSSDTAGGTACLGGAEGASPEGTCDGPVGVTVLDTHSDTERDEVGNSSHAYESSNGATICLGGENEDGVCETFGLVVLHSDSESHAEPGDAEAEGGAYVLGIDQGGERTAYIEDETSIAVPPDCPKGGSVLCLLLNHDETGALADGSGHDATGLGGDILPGMLDGENAGDADATDVGTTAVASEGEEAPEEPPVVKPEGPQEQDPTVQGQQASQLPFTGMDTSTMLAIAMMLLLSGVGILVLAARRETQTR
jgi:hypothetical protein